MPAGRDAGQPMAQSMAETVVDQATGWLLSFATQLVVLPAAGCSLTLGQNLAVGGVFGVVAFARKLLWRRVFNAIQVRRAAA